MSLIGALTKAAKAGEAAKKTAPFYSAVDEALANLKRPKGTGIEFLTEVMKQPGVKKAEIADRKLEQAFKAKGKMTKEEAQQVLKENPPPKLQEREYNEKMVRDEEDIKEALAQEKYGRSYDDLTQRERNPIYDEAQRIMDEQNGPRYGDYMLPGGQNYREILLKLPSERPNAANYSDPAKYDADMRAFNASFKRDYQSKHWNEDPNVLAHMRVQDRTGPNGEKILHVEEIQSDWHQEGRKKGYKNQEDYLNQKKQIQDKLNLIEPQLQAIGQSIYDFKLGNGFTMDDYRNLHKKSSELQSQRSELLDESQKLDMRTKSGIPDAPFKKNWHELAMKRLLNYAADNGYDSIAITPGAEQAKRYDLSKHLNEINYGKNPNGTFSLTAVDKNGRPALNEQGLSESQLESMVGKDLTQKIIAGEGNDFPAGSISEGKKSLSGLDLQVGGEGMKGFYDKMLPDYLNSFGKPYGSQVGAINITSSRGAPPIPEIQRMAGITQEQWRAMTGDERVRLSEEMKAKANSEMFLHNFPITPEMRESIKQKGLPLYQQIGIPTAGAGAASQMPEEPEYQAGGIAKLIKKSVPLVKAPEIIKPSGLTELKNIVRQEKGAYGARRLERAADEIPNLEKMYQERALREAFTGDNAKALMTMSPADFEKFAAKLPTLNLGGLEDDYINYLRKLPEGFRDVPFLEINKREQGASMLPFISGHEGRHRSRALTSNEEPTSLVRLLPRSELREPFPRRSQEEYIEAMKRELELTGNKVKPEPYTELDSIKVINRPPIDLPDIYAKGGSVKMATGGSVAKMTALEKLKQLKQEMAPRAEAVKALMAKDSNQYLRDVTPNVLTNAEIQAEIERMAARAKASGQQEGVLPAAERDANLAKFLELSAVKEKLFRGNRKAPKADKFVTTQDRATPSFTNDPDVANVYSQQLGWDIAHGPGSTSVPVYTQMEKPFDIRKKGEHVTLDEIIDQMDHDFTVPRHPTKLGYEDLADILGTLDHHAQKGNAKQNIDAIDKRGTFRIRNFSQLADEISHAGSKKDIDRILYDLLPDASIDAYALADSHEMVKQLKKQGFDSMIHKDVFDAGMPYYKGNPSKIEEGFDSDYVIDAFRPFNQNKIKSAIGNRGTYDITDPDITKARGGSVKHQVKKADGGAINYNTAPDMSDGGRIIQGAPFKRGGKVKMTPNRDTMFMELSDKKLKRK